ncbi:MAG: tyrosine-type recombinase/integrase [bacterium]|nr:tyrosine-type recombinase/integrase [bacterium]
MEPGLTAPLEFKPRPVERRRPADRAPKRQKRAARRKKLTKRAVDAARYEPPASHPRGAYYVWDTEMAGFGLRVYPSGRKVFVLTYRVKGKQRFYSLGRYGEMTVHEARTEALDVLRQARKGKDPAEGRMAYRRAPTMADLAERFIEEHSKVNKKPVCVDQDRQRFRRHVLPRLGSRRVVDITRTDIAEIHTAMAATPGAANNVRGLLSKAFSLAEVWGWRPEGSNPVRHVQRYKVPKRERHLSATELSRLSEVLAEAERSGSVLPEAITAIRLLILTGCRRNEILELRWDYVDFEAGCLRLPDSKTGPKTVPLNSAALQVLSEIERRADGPFVIPGRKPGSHLHSLNSQWQRIRSAAGLEDVRLHDLRHSYASFGVNLGLPLPMIGKVLGHSNASMTERYAHLADDPVREANERIGAHIAAVMSGQPKVDGVPIGT